MEHERRACMTQTMPTFRCRLSCVVFTVALFLHVFAAVAALQAVRHDLCTLNNIPWFRSNRLNAKHCQGTHDSRRCGLQAFLALPRLKLITLSRFPLQLSSAFWRFWRQPYSYGCRLHFQVGNRTDCVEQMGKGQADQR